MSEDRQTVRALFTRQDAYEKRHLVHPFPAPGLEDAIQRGYRVECSGDMVVRDAVILEFSEVEDEMCVSCKKTIADNAVKHGVAPLGYDIEDFKDMELNLEERYDE